MNLPRVGGGCGGVGVCIQSIFISRFDPKNGPESIFFFRVSFFKNLFRAPILPSTKLSETHRS